MCVSAECCVTGLTGVSYVGMSEDLDSTQDINHLNLKIESEPS